GYCSARTTWAVSGSWTSAPTRSSDSTRPAAMRSALAEATLCSDDSGTRSVTDVMTVRCDTFASDFTLRSAASAAPAAASVSAPSPGTPLGQAERCTEPSRYQDHTSSVANGSTGANRPRKASSACTSVERADAAAGEHSECGSMGSPRGAPS